MVQASAFGIKKSPTCRIVAVKMLKGILLQSWDVMNERVAFVGSEGTIEFPAYPTLYHHARLILYQTRQVKFI